MDVVELLKIGGTIKLDRKMGLKDWYSEISLYYLKNKPIFQGFDYYNYKINLTIEDSVYVFLSEYRHWENYAYLTTRLKSKNLITEDDYDFEYPTIGFIELLDKEKELAKQDWGKEFSQEKLNSLKKPVINDIERGLESLLKGKEYKEYCDILTGYYQELFDLGVDFRIYFHFERVGNGGSYGVGFENKENKKKQINALIDNQFESIKYDSITITVFIDEKKYTYNEYR